MTWPVPTVRDAILLVEQDGWSLVAPKGAIVSTGIRTSPEP